MATYLSLTKKTTRYLTRLASPILQLDGIETSNVSQQQVKTTMFYNFKSKHSEDNIINSLREMWPKDGATSTELVLRERLGSLSQDHLCTLKVLTTVKNFSWPTTKASPLLDVFYKVKKNLEAGFPPPSYYWVVFLPHISNFNNLYQ